MLAPFAGTVVAVWHDDQDSVMAGQALVVLEAMKMEHEVVAEVDGTVRSLEVAVGDTVEPGQRLAILEPAEGETPAVGGDAAPEDHPRDQLDAVLADTSRPSTTPAPTRSPSATPRAGAPRERTWPT